MVNLIFLCIVNFITLITRFYYVFSFRKWTFYITFPLDNGPTTGIEALDFRLMLRSGGSLLMARTYRQSLLLTMSGVAPTPDLRA